MKKFTKKHFLQNFSSSPKFHKKLLKQGNVAWSLIKDNPYDYYTANSGSVNGIIYYQDTVSFARKHHLQILQVLEDFENEYGKLKNRPNPIDDTQYFNWLTWFAWENMMSEIVSFLEFN